MLHAHTANENIHTIFGFFSDFLHFEAFTTENEKNESCSGGYPELIYSVGGGVD